MLARRGGDAQLFPVSNNQLQTPQLVPSNGLITAAEFTVSGKRLVVGEDRGAISFLDVSSHQNPKELFSIASHSGTASVIWLLDFSDDGRTLVSTDESHQFIHQTAGWDNWPDQRN